MNNESISYQLEKDKISYFLTIINKNNSNQLVIECKNNFNNYTYSSILDFHKCQFLNCFSSQEAINLLSKTFDKQRIFIERENDSEMIILIVIEEDSSLMFFENKIDIIDIESLYEKSNLKIYSLKLKNIKDTKLSENEDICNFIRKKKEYVLWRDQNLKSFFLYPNFLLLLKMVCNINANMNVYFGISIEDMLKSILKNKYDKLILISNIGLDLSGKRYVEVARKILGFNIIVLFFSCNRSHLDWIKDFPNCLYTDNIYLYGEYLTNYNEEGLRNLKQKVEKMYNIKLKDFTDDFLLYPNYGKNENISYNDNDINQYLRHVKIYNEKNKLYLYMNANRKVECNKTGSQWDITILNNEITFYSNGYYLELDNINNENIIGLPYLRIWNFEKKEHDFYIINPKKTENNILSIENGELKVNKNKPEDSEIFKLIDIADDDNIENYSFSSDISQFNSYIEEIKGINNNSNSSIKIDDEVKSISI